MNVIIVDDERIVLSAETLAVKRVLPEAMVHSFQNAREAMEFARENSVDIAFLDINIKGITGLELAKKMKACNPKTNVIFCTGYSEYSLEAHELYCSGYLMKPVTDEKLMKALENLSFPLSTKIKGLFVQCFGNFEVYKDGEPIKFKHKKTKELLAYLVDRCGATVSTKEMMIALYEDNDRESYIRNLRADLNNTLEQMGCGEALIHSGGDVGVQRNKIECDYFDYLDGHKTLFHGEYMSQYSFSEKTLGWLMNNRG